MEKHLLELVYLTGQDWCREYSFGGVIKFAHKLDSKGNVIEEEKVYVAYLRWAKKLAEEDGWNGELLKETDVLDTWFSSALASHFLR